MQIFANYFRDEFHINNNEPFSRIQTPRTGNKRIKFIKKIPFDIFCEKPAKLLRIW